MVNSFQSGLVNRKGQYVIRGKAKWKNVKHEASCNRRSTKLEGQQGALAELYVDSETKGDCDQP